jgi:NAD(P)-dependent dehydrogenase (short-subunit alcohol dehydrogenase family)
MKVCIVGASGKLGHYMVQHALDRNYEVVGVCREESVGKLDAFKERITVVPGATNDPEVIKQAVASCDGVLVVLVPRGVHGYSTGTAQAVLEHAPPGARLVFSCGWHISRDGMDVYSWKLKALVKYGGWVGRVTRFADLNDQVEACRRVFGSDTLWTSRARLPDPGTTTATARCPAGGDAAASDPWPPLTAANSVRRARNV